MKKPPRAHRRARWLIGSLVWAAFAATQAQTVYRCESQGRVAYSHDPCIGAQVVDTTPTQGLDKSTGRSIKGHDVQREEFKRLLNEAMRPMTGMSHDQTKRFERRRKLTAAAQVECKLLDFQLPGRAEAVRNSVASEKAEAEVELYLSRKRFRELGC